MNILDIKNEIIDRLDKQESCFGGVEAALLKVSAEYPGLWLEHIYDSIVYARLDNSKLYLAENAINAFIDLQKDDGQLPYVIRDAKDGDRAGYSQIQECVSFGSLCLMVYEKNNDREFLKKCYHATERWVCWIKNHRMTRGLGLVEMFFGFDTGHDNSPRVLDLGAPKNYIVDGKAVNAAALPPKDEKSPIIALDMSCNYYGNLRALKKMADILGYDGKEFADEARSVKQKIFDICFDKADRFFYDVDVQGNKRRILSCQIFHLFIEGVLDKDEDKELISELCDRYIFNEKHFYTPYPFPALSISDEKWKKHSEYNCWGYYTQTLTVLRTTIWMDKYGFEKEHDEICRRFLSAWTACFDRVKLGQELDPLTGEPSQCSEWYSSGMLTYLYCTERLKLI